MSQVYYVIYLYYLHVILLLYVLFCLKRITRTYAFQLSFMIRDQVLKKYINTFLSALSSSKYDLLLFEREQQHMIHTRVSTF